MAYDLGERHKNYEEAYDLKIIRRIPIIIRIDGRSFSRLTKRLPRPFSGDMINLMSNAMLVVAKEIEGCVFGYQQSDEITLILRNDQSLTSEPWFGNRVQKMVSVASASATQAFNDLYKKMPEPIELVGPAIFDARVFGVPSINEAVNNLIFRQQDCLRNAVTAAAQAELRSRHGRKTADRILQKRTTIERAEMLRDECGIDFNTHYPSAFRNGVATYKIPKIIETENGQLTRQRWALDTDIPVFSKSRDFILGILNTGRDIFRADRDLDDT